jgi:hypothetical protein
MGKVYMKLTDTSDVNACTLVQRHRHFGFRDRGRKEILIINRKTEMFIENVGAIRFHEGNCTYHL